RSSDLRLLLDLSDLFRAALAGPGELPLEDELGLARRYLEIEALRFGPRLQVNWQLPAPLPEVWVPTLSIQPLVENAIRHGIEPSPAAGGWTSKCGAKPAKSGSWCATTCRMAGRGL